MAADYSTWNASEQQEKKKRNCKNTEEHSSTYGYKGNIQLKMVVLKPTSVQKKANLRSTYTQLAPHHFTRKFQKHPLLCSPCAPTQHVPRSLASKPGGRHSCHTAKVLGTKTLLWMEKLFCFSNWDGSGAYSGCESSSPHISGECSPPAHFLCEDTLYLPHLGPLTLQKSIQELWAQNRM